MLKPTRTVPSTPAKRPNSSLLTPASSKKFKAPLSAEARISKTVNAIPPSRPKTPSTPVRASTDAAHEIPSAMDVSRVDPEAVLVHCESVDVSELGQLDSEPVSNSSNPNEKVTVTVRLRTTDTPSSWTVSPHAPTITPAAPHPTSANPITYTFDSIHTASPNAPLYASAAAAPVAAAMAGYNAVVFAYGQTASGKTFTLTGDKENPGIIPRALRDVFRAIQKDAEREYLLRCSYLEIYNEQVFDLLAPSTPANANVVSISGGNTANGADVRLTPLREEVIISLAGAHAVLKRGEANRRTACTDWNERSSRSHSVFRVVIESRERTDDSPSPNGRQTPGISGRQTPAGGPRLQPKGGRAVRTSVLSLIDLAGSERATSDKDRAREGKYINTSLLTLGSVIGTLAENHAKGKQDHVPYRNSKLTRLLQPSLAGNARISVICTLNPSAGAFAESQATLNFAKRIKGVHLHATKREVLSEDEGVLLERYRREIEDLKRRLEEREREAPVRNRRLSAKEQLDEGTAMRDLQSRIAQLTKLILTSQTVDSALSRPGSPSKLDFDASPYQLQQELLAARLQIEAQQTQILSLEAALLVRGESTTEDASSSESPPTPTLTTSASTDTLTARAERAERKLVEATTWADELVRQLERERRTKDRLEEERKALRAFVERFDALGLGGDPTKARVVAGSGGRGAVFGSSTPSDKRLARRPDPVPRLSAIVEAESPLRLGDGGAGGSGGLDASLLEQTPMSLGDDWALLDLSFEGPPVPVVSKVLKGFRRGFGEKDKEREKSPVRGDVLVASGKENLPVG